MYPTFCFLQNYPHPKWGLTWIFHADVRVIGLLVCRADSVKAKVLQKFRKAISYRAADGSLLSLLLTCIPIFLISHADTQNLEISDQVSMPSAL
jgi:hypothetical protein